MRERVRVVQEVGERSLTKESMALESDINQIVARHVAHNAPLFDDGRGRYGDFTGLNDFHAALNAVKSAEDEFMKLPAQIRDACENDPGVFLEMVYSEDGRKVLAELGMSDLAVPANALPDPAPEPVVGASGAPGAVPVATAKGVPAGGTVSGT